MVKNKKFNNWRKNNIPKFKYYDHLPITSKKDIIINAILENSVVIISGETGSGKTTQLPKFCLDANCGINGKIGCTQPRRIAAQTVAARIAYEFNDKVGNSVGYKIRFCDKVSKNSYLKIMTDGILLAETLNDPFLYEYDTIIIDEAHERSINIDFILGILKKILKKRNDLKVIISSATIDTEKFSKAFNNAPIIEVSGRLYPIETRYFVEDQKSKNREGDADNNSDEKTYVEMAIEAIFQIQAQSYHGDILIFMPTEQDILETCKLIDQNNKINALTFPLFARLSANDQSKIFLSQNKRKIIVATNIAETSITIPGIKYVIDSGYARIPTYSPNTRITSLNIMPISQSSADQRKGRCGRVESGICIRLFSEQDYLSRPLFTKPEILRTSLAEVILRMTALNLGDISTFDFIDTPSQRNIKDSYDLLYELCAIKKSTNKKGSKEKTQYILTKQGKIMAKIPIDPQLSKILLEAQDKGCLKEAAIITAVLSVTDPRQRPLENITQANQAHSKYNDNQSDFVTFLNIFNAFQLAKKNKSRNQIKKFCKTNFLSYKKINEWQDVYNQLIEIFKDAGLDTKKESEKILYNARFSDKYIKIHKAIISGFLSNFALKKEKNIYKAAKNKEVMIFPGSALFNKGSRWIICGQIVKTSQLFARTVANIESDWIEEAGKFFCKYAYLEPNWDLHRGEVVAKKQVSLFGIILSSNKLASYGPINPNEACEIFIRRALVEGDIIEKFDFLKYNKKILADIINTENKFRKKGWLIDEDVIFQFYYEKLKNIYNIKGLKKLIKDNGSDDFLKMERKDVLKTSIDHQQLKLYPDNISLGNKIFKCKYNFAPEGTDDGLTVKIPMHLTNQISKQEVDWLVPGLLKDKITFLIKNLPKEYRKKLVPINKTVNYIIEKIPQENKNLTFALSNFILKQFKVKIPKDAWIKDITPDYLNMRLSILNQKGKEIYVSRDKNILDQNILDNNFLHESNNNEFEKAKLKWEKSGFKKWDFEDIPESISIPSKVGKCSLAYLGLFKKNNENTVGIKLFNSKQEAINFHENGVSFLYSIYFSKQINCLKKMMYYIEKNKKAFVYFKGIDKIKDDVSKSIEKSLFTKNIRTKLNFFDYAENIKQKIIDVGLEKFKAVCLVIQEVYATRLNIYNFETENKNNKLIIDFLKQLRCDLNKLVPENFILIYDIDRINQIVRYVQGINIRASRGINDLAKDKKKACEIKYFTEKLNKLIKDLDSDSSDVKRKEIENFFWLIEEYKIAIFAQELKTDFPVSKIKLNKIYDNILNMY